MYCMYNTVNIYDGSKDIGIGDDGPLFDTYSTEYCSDRLTDMLTIWSDMNL